jgi:hypothetical protein
MKGRKVALLVLAFVLMVIGGLRAIDGVIGLIALLYYLPSSMKYQILSLSELIQPLGTTITGILIFALGGYLCHVAYRNAKQKEVAH